MGCRFKGQEIVINIAKLFKKAWTSFFIHSPDLARGKMSLYNVHTIVLYSTIVLSIPYLRNPKLTMFYGSFSSPTSSNFPIWKKHLRCCFFKFSVQTILQLLTVFSEASQCSYMHTLPNIALFIAFVVCCQLLSVQNIMENSSVKNLKEAGHLICIECANSAICTFNPNYAWSDLLFQHGGGCLGKLTMRLSLRGPPQEPPS